MKKLFALVLASLMLFALCACGAEAEPEPYTGLQAGYSKVNITPDYEVGLGGYSDAETRTATGLIEYIYLTCIAVSSGDETILIYTIDNCSFNHDQAEQLRTQVNLATQIHGEKIFVGATHGHNCPAFSAYENGPKYLTDVILAGVQAAQEAIADLSPATLYRAKETHEGMNFVRHYTLNGDTYVASSGANGHEDQITGHPMESDEEMTILKFERADETKKDILMVNWQSHPDSASSIGYTMISPGFIGPLRNTLEKESGMLVAYFTGAAGNQNNDSKWKEEAHNLKWNKYGEELGKLAAGMLDKFEPVEGTEIKTVRVMQTLEIDHSWDHMLAQANEVYEVWKTQGKEAGDALGATYGFTSSYQARAIRSRASMGPTIAMEMNVFCIGGVGFTTGTYEMFSTNALFVKENSPFETTFVICGTSTYMPADIAYTYRGYEQDTTFYTRGSAEIMADKYVEMLNQIKPTQ